MVESDSDQVNFYLGSRVSDDIRYSSEISDPGLQNINESVAQAPNIIKAQIKQQEKIQRVKDIVF